MQNILLIFSSDQLYSWFSIFLLFIFPFFEGNQFQEENQLHWTSFLFYHFLNNITFIINTDITNLRFKLLKIKLRLVNSIFIFKYQGNYPPLKAINFNLHTGKDWNVNKFKKFEIILSFACRCWISASVFFSPIAPILLKNIAESYNNNNFFSSQLSLYIWFLIDWICI